MTKSLDRGGLPHGGDVGPDTLLEGVLASLHLVEDGGVARAAEGRLAAEHDVGDHADRPARPSSRRKATRRTTSRSFVEGESEDE